MLAFTFNLGTYLLVWWGSRERRVTRTTSLYLLAFVFVWLPSLTKAIKVYFFDMHAGFVLAAAEAICMPLQGALNAAVYGWSLPSIRDFYKSLFLGYESLDRRRGSRTSSRSPSSPYERQSPPDSLVRPSALEAEAGPEAGDAEAVDPIVHGAIEPGGGGAEGSGIAVGGSADPKAEPLMGGGAWRG